MSKTWIGAFVAVAAMAAAGCEPEQGLQTRPAAVELVANPTYKAWEAFGVGSTATLEGVRKTGDAPAGRKVRITQKLVEKTAARVVIERTIQPLEGEAASKPPIVTCKIEPAKIEPEDNPRTHPDRKVKDQGELWVKLQGQWMRCKVSEAQIHVEYGEPLPSKEDVVLRTAVNEKVPGGTVELLLSRHSSTHDLEIDARLVGYEVKP